MEETGFLSCVAVFVISLCGIFGNGVALKAAFKASDVKTTFTVFCILMMTSDLAQLVQVMGMQMYRLLAGNKHSAALTAGVDLTSKLSLLSVTGLAVDRCLAVKRAPFFTYWNSRFGILVAVSATIVISCGITQWPGCEEIVQVSVSGIITYLVTMFVGAVALGTTCIMNKWTTHLDTRVSDITTEQQTGQRGQQSLQYIIQCCKAARWVIVEVIFANSVLCSVAFAIKVHEYKCLSSVHPIWWYRILLVTTTSVKPFILFLMSRHFRKSVMLICFRNPSPRPRLLFDSWEVQEDGINVNRRQNSRYTAGTGSSFAVTSVDSNDLASSVRDDENAKAAVATFQGLRYPFKIPAGSPIMKTSHQKNHQTSTSALVEGSVKSSCTASSRLQSVESVLDVPSKLNHTECNPNGALPGNDQEQSSVSRSLSAEETISVSVNCNFQVVIGRASSTSSCPGLLASSTDNGDIFQEVPLKRRRANTFVTKPKRSKTLDVQLSPYNRNLLDAETTSGNLKNSSGNLKCVDLNGSDDSLSVFYNYPETGLEVTEECHNNSMCNFVRATGNKLSLRSISSDSCPTIETTENSHGQYPEVISSDVAPGSDGNCMTNIICTTDKNGSTTGVMAGVSEIRTESTFDTEVIANDASLSLNNYTSTPICTTSSKDTMSKYSRETTGNGNARSITQSGGRRKSTHNTGGTAIRTERRCTFEFTKKDTDVEKVSAVETFIKDLKLKIPSRKRLLPHNLQGNSPEHPPKIRLAFPSPGPIDKEDVEIHSNPTSPSTRTRVSVFDPDSYVYLGSL